MAPLTSAQRQANYRKRKREQLNVSIGSSSASTAAERQAACRKRKREQTITINLESKWNMEFKKRFADNGFGFVCNVCDRLWYKNDLSRISSKCYALIQKEFPLQCVKNMMACSTCKSSIDKHKIPQLSSSNGFKYPEYPNHLPDLGVIAERLVSPRLPFMQIRRLRYQQGTYKIIGQVINVPVDVNNMVNMLPRALDDDFTINVNIKRHLLHKSSYIEGFVNKDTVKKWLNYLINKPLYVHHNIQIDEHFFLHSIASKDVDVLEPLEFDDAQENLLGQQHTLFWSEDKYLNLAPGQKEKPLSLLYDQYAEELSFPKIYLGYPRVFKSDVNVTPFMMATSEIRRRDRRGVTPHHILYMAMKILRIRVSEGLYLAFRASDMEHTTRKMIEDKDYIESCIDTNLSFMKSIPNSAQYWIERKRSLFAMMRQLGKPTMFLTLSASEVKWDDLIRLLHRLKYHREADNVESLSAMARASLVNEDPVTCNLYFNKLVDVLMAMLQLKKNGPFGDNYVVDYFKRIEFQHRGSAHAHILLWLNNAPDEKVGADMSESIKLIDRLVSVDKNHLSPKFIDSQTHRHTFTCYKKNTTICRFHAPFFPMVRTEVLLPLTTNDGRSKDLKRRFNQLKLNLENESYDSIEQFWSKNGILNEGQYYSIIQSGLSRPMMFPQRDIKNIWTNNFNPWLASILRSNMDLQYILEEYSCAAYVADYINKTNRGISNLHRKLLQMQDEHPEKDYAEILISIGIEVLNSVEMSAQEAAWFLLRLPMSKTSRNIEFITTSWPQDRLKVRKTKEQLDREMIEQDSGEIWRDTIIEKYEKRPENMNTVSLIDFVSLWTKRPSGEYYMRKQAKIVRWIDYDVDKDYDNYRREMVLLFHSFRNEEDDLLSGEKYKQIYLENEQQLLKLKKKYCSNLDIVATLKICREMNQLEDEEVLKSDIVDDVNINRLVDYDMIANTPNNDDIKNLQMDRIGIVAKRENVLNHVDYCSMIRLTNKEQRELILEAIYRLHDSDSDPIQIFFSGPAGCGKTFTLKALMETYNRFSQQHNAIYNAYISCASTGKAAVAIGGQTVHSVFKITISKRDSGFTYQNLQMYRSTFRNICIVFIDEVSMIGAELLNTLNSKLQQVTSEFDKPFGGMNIVFCGDLRQLPPVRATPIYRRPKAVFGGDILWRQIKYFPLLKVVRQSDVLFSSILTKIGNGDSLSAEELSIIESRFVKIEEIQDICSDGIRLFFRNIDVSSYNRASFQSETTVEHAATDTYVNYTDTTQRDHFREKVHKMSYNETGGLSYYLKLLLGKPYMITTNVNVVDGLANGAMGYLRFIEYQPDNTIHRLWLEFTDPRIGRALRLNYKVHIQENVELKNSWTPVIKRSATITSRNKQLKVKRIQFPLIESAAVTIHKSQGATYNKIVYMYHRSHEHQLVYVALSRVTDLSGLYLTNMENDFKFYHSNRSKNSDLRREMSRLETTPLDTVTKRCEQHIMNADASTALVNAQSLHAHNKDITTDNVLNKIVIILCTETWMDDDNVVELDGFQCKSFRKRKRDRAGGVAIYKNNNSPLSVDEHILHMNDHILGSSRSTMPEIGDICAVEVVIRGQRCIMVSVYLSPNTCMADIRAFLAMNLGAYTRKFTEVFPDIIRFNLTDLPMIVAGDFNLDIKKKENEEFVNFMKNYLEIDLCYTKSLSTTKNNTCIDLMFSRNCEGVDYMKYVSYFSYHDPILAVIKV